MKKNLLHTFLFILCGIQALAQAPSLSWQKNIGGSAGEFDLICSQNFQGDIFIAGTTYSSSSGDIPLNNGGADIYIAKLNASGNESWSHNFGGSLDDSPISIAPTSDGGVIILCYVASTNAGGDFNQAGVWLLKLNNDGSTGFKTFYGGNPNLKGKVIQTSDGGYMFHSIKTVGVNGLDSWIYKTHSDGTYDWDATYGGTSDEFAADILEFGGDYYVLGESNSSTVNGKSNHGLSDLLLLKINSTGVNQWTRLMGGNGNDGGVRLVLDDAKNLLILGYNSSIGGNVLENNGGIDFWIINMDTTGFSSNNYSVGKISDDYPSDIYFNESTFSGVVVGETYSSGWAPVPSTDPIISNFLVAELIPFGGTAWTDALGGGDSDAPTSIIGTIDGGLLISGHSYSNDGDLTGNNGDSDFWLVKLMYQCPDELTLNAANFSKSLSRTAESSINTNSKYTGLQTKVKLTSSYVQMNEGFEVEAGTVFETEIGGCPN